MASQGCESGKPRQLYEQLGAGDIRLLHLEPSADRSSTIRGRLAPYNLSDLVQKEGSTYDTFEALSYTWGDSSDPETMVLNGFQHDITSHLAAFLRQRRESGEEVVLWIDAVCIDQSDAHDKNQQVPHMGMIYAAASDLTIWLGPSGDDSRLAIDELRKLSAESPYDKMPYLSSEASGSVQRLFERPWWTRTWIVQEIAFGGMGSKAARVRIQCGPDSLQWMSLVVAAARMKAHQDDLRQRLPVVTSILELDSLRDGLGAVLRNPDAQSFRFELLCRFRRFLATDPRDKIYALYNMFNMAYEDLIETRYEARVEDVYSEFARFAIASQDGLEILRHCSSNTREMPSWVPDWSHPLPCRPLPARKIPKFFDVPWWAEVAREATDDEFLSFLVGNKPRPPPKYRLYRPVEKEEFHRNSRLKRLELAARGFGIAESFDDIPFDWKIHRMPSFVKRELERQISSKKTILMVRDDRLNYPDVPSDSLRNSALYQGEIVTERRMKGWLLQRLSSANSKPPYRATLSEKHDVQFEPSDGVLTLTGMVVAEVETLHEPFVDGLEHDWKRATVFMVAIGCCKRLATSHVAAKLRYQGQGKLLEAFWSTIFAGNPTPPEYIEPDMKSALSRCSEWLPEIPESWTWPCPPLTATNSGQLDLAVQAQVAQGAVDEINESHDGGGSLAVEFLMEFDGLVPREWRKDERELRKAEFQELGIMWTKQPYDLYHRPFQLLHTVPDPYWDVRKVSMAQDGQRVQNDEMAIISRVPSTNDATNKNSEDFQSLVTKRLKETPLIAPKGTLWPGLEKYALGRRFFITKDGYFGLGPPDMQSGDRIALLFGSPVPFVLRRVLTRSRRAAWKLVGETYVHGMMGGEFLGEGGIPATQAERISIV